MPASPDLPLGISIAIVISCIVPVVIVWIVLRHFRERAALKYKALLDLVERGAPVPAEMLTDTQVGQRRGDLRRGLVLTFTGIGVVVFAFTLPQHQAWGIGLLPLFAGLGYLATWVFSKPSKSLGDDA